MIGLEAAIDDCRLSGAATMASRMERLMKAASELLPVHQALQDRVEVYEQALKDIIPERGYGDDCDHWAQVRMMTKIAREALKSQGVRY